MTKKLPESYMEVYEGCMYDLFLAAGYITFDRSARASNFAYRLGVSENEIELLVNLNPINALDFVNFIKDRPVDYQAIEEIDVLCDSIWAYTQDLAHRIPFRDVQGTPLKHILAYFCASKELYFDDSNKTAYEMEEIKKIELGNLLWEYEAFNSQQIKKADETQAKISKALNKNKGD